MVSPSTIISLLGVLSGLSPIFSIILLKLIACPNYYVVFSLSLIFILISYIHMIMSYSNDCLFNKKNFFSAFSLGFISTLAILLMFKMPYHYIFSIYIIQLCFFHWSEFFITSINNPGGLKIDFYMLNHSQEYKIALLLSVLEYWIEKTYFPEFFNYFQWLKYIGLIMSISGEILRKVSLWTAGKNFNHYVEIQKRDDHVLVRSGVYNWFRHPSYVGWFYFSVGTQIALLNPICIVGYTIASWTFFADRIYEEERSLIRFFGEDYITYQSEVGTGLPFIKGCLLRRADTNLYVQRSID